MERRIHKTQLKHGSGKYSKSKPTEWQACYLFALLEALQIINDKAKEKRISDEPIMEYDKWGIQHNTGETAIDRLLDANALVDYVRVRGDQIVYLRQC